MAVTFRHFTPSPFSTSPSPFHSLASSRRSIFSRPPNSIKASVSFHIDENDEGRRKFMEFPYVSPPHRNLMVDLVSAVANRLELQLLTCNLPPDVQYYENENRTARASLQIRSGNHSSPVDFILGSWLHCILPAGEELNITSFSAYLNSSTDAPNFIIELIQTTPTLILILDLPPRKDLVLHPDYLNTFYEQTHLDTHRQMLYKLPEVTPYFSSSLFIHSVVSPTAIMVNIRTKKDDLGRIEEILKNHVNPIAKEMLKIWLDKCAYGERKVEDMERVYLEKRDRLIKNKTIEIDLGSNLPKLFGTEIGNRVLEAVKKVFTG